MESWALIRFVHVAAAATWLGMQVALFLLVPALRRLLPADEARRVVRAAGTRLALIAAVALPALLLSGIALGRHEPAAAEHPGGVALKQAILAAMVGLLLAHGLVPGRTLRVVASALMLALTLVAVYAGAWLAAQ